MSKIPNSEKKKVIALSWYKNYSERKLRKTFKEIITKNDGNMNDHQLRKQDIVLLIEEFGLPDFATNEDYENYIDDPMIIKKFKREELNNINVEL